MGGVLWVSCSWLLLYSARRQLSQYLPAIPGFNPNMIGINAVDPHITPMHNEPRNADSEFSPKIACPSSGTIRVTITMFRINTTIIIHDAILFLINMKMPPINNVRDTVIPTANTGSTTFSNDIPVLLIQRIQSIIPKITNSEPLNLQGNDGSIIIRGSSAFSPFSPVPKGVMLLPSGIQSSISTPPKYPIHQKLGGLELVSQGTHIQLSEKFR